jgi:hypothetical protein
MLEAHLFPANAPNVREMPHIAHKGGSQELSHVQKLNKQVGWPRKEKEKWRRSFSRWVWP